MTPDIPKNILKELKAVAINYGWDKIEIFKTLDGRNIMFNNMPIYRFSRINQCGKCGMPILYATNENGQMSFLEIEQIISASLLVKHPNEVFDGFSVDKQVVNP
ncbi:MAG: hypothetical protein II752_06865 [Muribaculaceae bacterium]|nr:hypothetical protein [Muribaculaceae bacterium]